MSKNSQVKIKKLLTDLEKSTGKREKHRIRASLRKLGHRGGLNRGKKTKKVSKSEKA